MFKYIVLGSALAIAVCSAWFSVTGIAQLFVGEYYGAVAMAISLEIGKLVAISFLYRYWNDISRSFKAYVIFGSFVLIFISSLGIFAFLSSAYASPMMEYQAQQGRVQTSDIQVESVERIISTIQSRIDQLYSARDIQESRLGDLVVISGPDTARTIDMSAFNTQQEIIRETDTQISQLQSELVSLVSQRDSLSMARFETISDVQQTTHMGTFQYMADMIGSDLDDMLVWFVLLIVIVFDPMAVSLVLAYNVIVVTGRSRITTTEEPTGTPEPIQDALEEPESHEEPSDKEDEWLPPPTIKNWTTGDPDEDRPYYTHEGYDWDKEQKWRKDPHAKAYYRNLVSNKKT